MNVTKLTTSTIYIKNLHKMWNWIFWYQIICQIKKKITLVHKKGKLHKICNYRPIANLCSITKVFERLILNRVLEIKSMSFVCVYKVPTPCSFYWLHSNANQVKYSSKVVSEMKYPVGKYVLYWNLCLPLEKTQYLQ